MIKRILGGYLLPLESQSKCYIWSKIQVLIITQPLVVAEGQDQMIMMSVLDFEMLRCEQRKGAAGSGGR